MLVVERINDPAPLVAQETEVVVRAFEEVVINSTSGSNSSVTAGDASKDKYLQVRQETGCFSRSRTRFVINM